MAMKKQKKKRRKEKELEEIEKVIEEYKQIKSTPCVDAKCGARKGYLITIYTRKLDKLLTRLAIAWHTHEEMKDEIEKIIELFMIEGMLTPQRWEYLKDLESRYIWIKDPMNQIISRLLKRGMIRDLLIELMDATKKAAQDEANKRYKYNSEDKEYDNRYY